ncbi:MAG: hypothetical protein ABIM89_19020 [Mycobacteriales bacterium]
MMPQHSTFAPSGTPVMSPPPADAPAPPPGYLPMQLALTPTQTPPFVVTNVMPQQAMSGTRRLIGRTPLIALALALLLAAAGAAYGTGMFTSAEKPDPVKRATVEPPLAPPTPAPQTLRSPVVKSAPTKPAARKPIPAIKAIAGERLTLTKSSSGTHGGGYTITVPTGWTSTIDGGGDLGGNSDIAMSNDGALQYFAMTSGRPSFVKGPLTPEKYAKMKALFLKDDGGQEVPGVVTATVAGTSVNGFDVDLSSTGLPAIARTVIFEHGGVVYSAAWVAGAGDFAVSVRIFDQILASLKFAS